ncbi:MAG: 30S ribosomal protein S16 [Prolixibacteraceae bacterium]
MPAKIRLQRHGRKRHAYYHIVVADSRAPRDGRYIERIGNYDPNTNPATIDLDFDKAISWLNKGAQPTDTARAILSYKGVLYMKHLLGGVAKGAFTEEEAERRFKVWMTEKDSKIQSKKDRLTKESESEKKARLEAEAKVNEERAAALSKKEADLAAAAAAEKAAKEKPVQEEAPAEEPAEGEPADAPAEEAASDEEKAAE